MKKNHWYPIDDMPEFVSSVRQMVLKSFYENEDKEQRTDFTDLFKEKADEIEDKLTLDEAQNIIESLIKKTKTKYGEEEYRFSHKTFNKIFEELNRRIIGNMLMELAVSGRVESAFDDKSNDFIFWIKE